MNDRPHNPTNIRTRYRVTGSIFLIALAIIVLPMLFDGAGAPMREAPSQLPLKNTSSVLPDFADVVPTSDVVARVEGLRGEVDADGFATDSGTRFGEPVLQPGDANSKIWAVQAASFASNDNALSFRSELRKAGFEAFISTVKDRTSDSGRMYRVAVGPLLSKVDAEEIQAAISADFSVQPTVVEMVQ